MTPRKRVAAAINKSGLLWAVFTTLLTLNLQKAVMLPAVWWSEDRPSWTEFHRSHVEAPYTMWILLRMLSLVIWPVVTIIGVAASAMAFEVGAPGEICYFLLFLAPMQLLALIASTKYRLAHVSQAFPPAASDSNASDVTRVGFLWLTSLLGLVLALILVTAFAWIDPLKWQ